MLYEVITIIEEQYDLAGKDVYLPLNSPFRSRISRITSYNVCYTKLLRMEFKLTTGSTWRSLLPAIANTLHRTFSSVGCGSNLKNVSIQGLVICCICVSINCDILSPACVWSNRITSYNVCYTKLLRFWNHFFHAHRFSGRQKCRIKYADQNRCRFW